MHLAARLLLPLLVLPAVLLGAGPAIADEPSLPSGVWPLDPEPEVVAGFAPPASAWGKGHRGVDLRGSVGQPVLAAADGTVAFAGMLAGRGVVTVDHGGVRSTYEPVDASVRAGDVVRAGQPLGTLSLVQSHCFPAACLHWGLLRGSDYLDPLQLVGDAPVRLLPLAALERSPLSTPAAWAPLLRLLQQWWLR